MTSINDKRFECMFCDFECSKLSDMKRHTTTLKHKMETVGNHKTEENEKGKEKEKEKCIVSFLLCECGKKYSNRSGLWKHKKKCEICQYEEKTQLNSLSEVVVELVKQNKEFKKMIVDLSSQSQTSSVVNNNTTINNKFNLNIFLNETCKDALNLTDFIDSLKLSLVDLENVGSIGFVKGISNIFIKGLKQLDVKKRPIHCSDLKRETMYIKNSDAWEKENEEKAHLKKAIKLIANKNITQIPEWRETNPEYMDSDSKKNDDYMNIIQETFTKESDETNYHKIIKNVAKNVIIDKN